MSDANDAIKIALRPVLPRVARLRLEPDEVLVIRADWDEDECARALAYLRKAGIERVVIVDQAVRFDVVKQEAVR